MSTLPTPLSSGGGYYIDPATGQARIDPRRRTGHSPGEVDNLLAQGYEFTAGPGGGGGGGGSVPEEAIFHDSQLYRGNLAPQFDFRYQQPGQFDPYLYHQGGPLNPSPNLLAQQPTSSNQSGSSTTNATISLPDAVDTRFQEQINTVGGLAASSGKDVDASRATATGAVSNLLASPGYTEDERAGLFISPEEEARISTQSMAPAIGAANRAQQNLLSYTAAAGNFNPGLNASMMEIQREQGRQASQARLQARLGVQEANRRATETAANARIGQENVGTQQAGNLLATTQNREANQLGNTTNLLTGYPERATSQNTTNSNISTSGPSSQVGIAPAPGAAPGAAPPPASRPSWMSDRQFRDYSNANPGTSGGGATPPRQGINSFYGTRSGNSGGGRLAYAF